MTPFAFPRVETESVRDDAARGLNNSSPARRPGLTILTPAERGGVSERLVQARADMAVSNESTLGLFAIPLLRPSRLLTGAGGFIPFDIGAGQMAEQTTRAEHLQWCKQRALEYVEAGDMPQAFASMASDLNKHPETRGHMAIQMGMAMLAGGHLDTAREMRDFIDGFN